MKTQPAPVSPELTATCQQAAAAVNSERLNQRLMELAQIGGRDDGGVSRETLTELDIKARQYLIDWGHQLGCEIWQDDCANLFFRRPGREDVPAVLTGSHLDTQPVGGKYDGAYGVVAGLELIAALNDADIQTRRPIDVVSWTNEEGSRFSPGTMGSSVFADPDKLTDYYQSVDAEGISFKQALDKVFTATSTSAPRRPVVDQRGRYAAGIELHIEQGPVLERADTDLGIVTSIQAVRWFSVCCEGAMGHAGTTPMNERNDAMRAAVWLAEQLHQRATQWYEDGIRLTLGRWQVSPNSINTIPGRVEFSVDVRCVNEVILDDFERSFQQLIEQMGTTLGWQGQISVKPLFQRSTTQFPENMLACTRRACTDTSQQMSLNTPLELTSGAFHDAMYLAECCPTAMIFVPSHLGISHNAAEFTQPQQLYSGVRALAYAVTELADSELAVSDPDIHGLKSPNKEPR